MDEPGPSSSPEALYQTVHQFIVNEGGVHKSSDLDAVSTPTANGVGQLEGFAAHASQLMSITAESKFVHPPMILNIGLLQVHVPRDVGRRRVHVPLREGRERLLVGAGLGHRLRLDVRVRNHRQGAFNAFSGHTWQLLNLIDGSTGAALSLVDARAQEAIDLARSELLQHVGLVDDQSVAQVVERTEQQWEVRACPIVWHTFSGSWATSRQSTPTNGASECRSTRSTTSATSTRSNLSRSFGDTTPRYADIFTLLVDFYRTPSFTMPTTRSVCCACISTEFEWVRSSLGTQKFIILFRLRVAAYGASVH